MSRSGLQSDLLVPTVAPSWITALDLTFSTLPALDIKAAGDGTFSHGGYSWAARDTANCSSLAFGASGLIGVVTSATGPTMALRVDGLVSGWIRQQTRFRVMFRLPAGKTLTADSTTYDLRFQDTSNAMPIASLLARGFRLSSGNYRVDACGWQAGSFFSYHTSGTVSGSTLPRWIVLDMEDGFVRTGWATTTEPPDSSDITRGARSYGTTGTEQMTNDARWVAMSFIGSGETMAYERVVVQYFT